MKRILLLFGILLVAAGQLQAQVSDCLSVYTLSGTKSFALDKIQKITGLDLRNFDDAIIFKVSMLVKKYLDKGERVL